VNKNIKQAVCMILVASVVFVQGCGGGGGAPTGTVRVAVDWPGRGRYVPAYANSVVATVDPEGANPKSATLNRNGDTGYQGVFDVPSPVISGIHTLRVDAYSGADGTGTKVATATKSITVIEGQVTTENVSTDMATTIHHVEIDSQPIRVDYGKTAQLQGHAEDANNVTLLLPPGSLTWSMVSGGSFASVTSDGLLAGLGFGQASVRLQESGAGVSVDAPATASGDRIAYSWGGRIYTMNEDGTDLVPLTGSGHGFSFPGDWSPDGSKLVFSRQSFVDSSYDVFVINSDGTNETRLTANEPVNDVFPTWNHDGTKIAFQSERNGGVDIYVMNADGSNVVRLTNLGQCIGPSWSPDGAKIAFQYANSIYVMNADGSNQVALMSSSSAGQPCWSPDGSKIAFTANVGNDLEIHVMKADGSNVSRLTTSAGADQDPAWRSDGSKIGFTSYRDGQYHVYLMNPDGTNQVRLTQTSDGHNCEFVRIP